MLILYVCKNERKNGQSRDMIQYMQQWTFHIKCRLYLGDNCIQNFHLGMYIVGYTVGNLVLRRRISGAVKRDFRTYIRRYTSPNENFEYDYPHSNALLTFSLQKYSENVLYCAYTSSDVTCKKPLASCIYSLVNQ